MTANEIVELAIETYVRELSDDAFDRLIAVARPTASHPTEAATTKVVA